MTPKNSEFQTLIWRAEIIFEAWLKAGRLTPPDIARVLGGQYHYFVTFVKGSKKHEIAKNSVVVLSGFNSLPEATWKAQEVFGDLVDKVIEEWRTDPTKLGAVAYTLKKGSEKHVKESND